MGVILRGQRAQGWTRSGLPQDKVLSPKWRPPSGIFACILESRPAPQLTLNPCKAGSPPGTEGDLPAAVSGCGEAKPAEGAPGPRSASRWRCRAAAPHRRRPGSAIFHFPAEGKASRTFPSWGAPRKSNEEKDPGNDVRSVDLWPGEAGGRVQGRERGSGSQRPEAPRLVHRATGSEGADEGQLPMARSSSPVAIWK